MLAIPPPPALRSQAYALTPELWCLNNPSYLSCSYLLRTAQGIWLFDAGMDSGGADMLSALAEMGASPQEVTAIFLTHWHNDHAAGAAALQALSGAPVYCHALEIPFLSRATATRGWRSRLADACPEWGLFVLFKGMFGNAIPRAIERLSPLEAGDTPFAGLEVLATPGHTAGHLAYYYRPGRMLFCGDAIAVLQGQPCFMARPITPDPPAARAAIVSCLAREIAWLCPGHRQPLACPTGEALRWFRAWVDSGGDWPLLGLVKRPE